MKRTYNTCIGIVTAEKIDGTYIVRNADNVKIGEVWKTFDFLTKSKFEYQLENSDISPAYSDTIKYAVESMAYHLKKYGEALLEEQERIAAAKPAARIAAADKKAKLAISQLADYGYPHTNAEYTRIERLKLDIHRAIVTPTAYSADEAEEAANEIKSICRDAILRIVERDDEARKTAHENDAPDWVEADELTPEQQLAHDLAFCKDQLSAAQAVGDIEDILAAQSELEDVEAQALAAADEQRAEAERAWLDEEEEAQEREARKEELRAALAIKVKPAPSACEIVLPVKSIITVSDAASFPNPATDQRPYLEIKASVENFGVFITTRIERGSEDGEVLFYTDRAVTVLTSGGVNNAEISTVWYPILAAQGTPQIANPNATPVEIAAFWAGQIENFCAMWERLAELLHAAHWFGIAHRDASYCLHKRLAGDNAAADELLRSYDAAKREFMKSPKQVRQLFT